MIGIMGALYKADRIIVIIDDQYRNINLRTKYIAVYEVPSNGYFRVVIIPYTPNPITFTDYFIGDIEPFKKDMTDMATAYTYLIESIQKAGI